MSPHRRTFLIALILAVAIAMPWLGFAWLTRPGVVRPEVGQVLGMFVMFGTIPVQFAVERMLEETRPTIGLVGLAAVGVSFAALALRLRSVVAFLLLVGFAAFIALTTFAIEKFFASRQAGRAV